MSDLDNLLARAKAALDNQDKREAGILIHRILKQDFIHQGAWQLLHQLFGAEESFRAFQVAFAKEHYPDKAHLLMETIRNSPMRSKAEKGEAMMSQSQTNKPGCFRFLADMFQIIGGVVAVVSLLVAVIALFYTIRNPDRVEDIVRALARAPTMPAPTSTIIADTPPSVSAPVSSSAGPTHTPTRTDIPTLDLTETPTPPPTDTATLTPQPTPIPISSVAILFEDDFSNPNRGWTDYNPGPMLIADGTLRIGIDSWLHKTRAANPGLQFIDFVLEVDTWNVTDIPSARMGIAFRADYHHNGSGDNSKYYYFTIGSDGTYELWRRYSWLDDDELLLPASISQAIKRSGVNRIHIEAVKGRFRFFVNDEFVAEYEDRSYLDFHGRDFSIGDIGLLVQDPKGSEVTVAFDNLVVGLLED